MRLRDDSERSPDSASEKEPEAAGWDALSTLTGGLPPEQIEELRAVRTLEPVYPLLHALAGRSMRDFLVRAAVLEALVQGGRAAYGSSELEEVLSFLEPEARAAALTTLRRSGWLEYSPATGTVVTDAGRWAFDILAFLHRRVAEAELLPTVAGIDYALQIGVDPVRHLLSMRARLNALRAEIEAARTSHSEVVLRRTARRIEDALQLSARIRAALDRVPLDHSAARAIAREIHGLLSQLHGAGSDLHAAVTEVGRQYLQLTGGLTTEQIVRALMARPLGDLAALGRESLSPVVCPPPLLTTDVLASAAEQQVIRERPAKQDFVWTEPEPAPRATADDTEPEDVRALLAELASLARNGISTQLADVVAKGSRGEAFLRLSLIALVGDVRAGEGYAGQLGALPLEITSSSPDGFPQSLTDRPISALTPAEIIPRSPETDRHG